MGQYYDAAGRWITGRGGVQIRKLGPLELLSVAVIENNPFTPSASKTSQIVNKLRQWGVWRGPDDIAPVKTPTPTSNGFPIFNFSLSDAWSYVSKPFSSILGSTKPAQKTDFVGIGFVVISAVALVLLVKRFKK